MKNIFTTSLVVLGVIFCCVLVALVYLWIADPFHLKPLFQGRALNVPGEEVPRLDTPDREIGEEVDEQASPTSTTPPHPSLTSAQEDALKLIGVNPEAVPEEITPEQMACFEQQLGKERVKEIQAGATPSVIEILKAKECL